MKERDYIGLGSDSSSSSSVTSAVTTVDGDYGDTELRLGIGPPAAGGSSSSNGGDAAAAKAEPNLALNQHESASPATVISPRKHGLNAAGQEHTPAASVGSVLPPASVSVVQSEVIIKPLAHHHGQEQKSFGGNADHKSSYGGGYNQMVAARPLPPPPPQAVIWHPTSSSSSSQLQPRVNGSDFTWAGYAIPVPKVASVPAKRPYPVDWPNTAVPMPLPTQTGWPLSNPAGDNKPGVTPPPAPSNIDHPAEPKARVVGWPPVRSFRKNTLAASSQSHPHLKKADHQLDIHGGGAAVEEENVAGSLIDPNKNALYVKAKVDGVKIGRKVDLKAYDSYDSLKLALQQMFQGYVNCHGEVVKLDLMHGNEYVLTHEDKDGDWMLVGDVPWEMFTATVKSLRILKSSDARGLGERASVAGKA